jgi:O-acetylserine/cysteine efflux transporter
VTNRNRALIALGAAGLLWGLTIPLSKVALDWLDPWWLTVGRFALAAPVLALLSLRSLRAALTPAVAGWGVLFYGAVMALQNLGVHATSVSHAALLYGAVPVMVALVTLARGRGSAGPQSWAGFALALAGVGLVAGSGGSSSMLGDGLILASAAASAFYIVAQPPLLQGRDPVAVTAVQMAAGTLAVLPLTLLLGGSPSGAPDAHALWSFAALVAAGSLLPFALYAYGQAHVEPEVAGAFVNLEPLVGAAVGAVAFQDPFGAANVVGAAAIVAGLLLSIERRGHMEPEAA